MTPVLEKIIELIARFLILVGVEPTENNMLIFLGVAIVLLLTYLLLSLEAERYRNPKRKPKRLVEIGPNPTNGLEYMPGDYPWVMRLTREDDLTGWLVKVGQGTESFLAVGDEYYNLQTIRQVTKDEIDAINDELNLEGLGTFSIQRGRWDVVRRLAFRTQVLDGTPPYFPGGAGMFEYIFAANAEQEGDDRDLLVLENPHIPNKPTKLVTWTLSVPGPLSAEEFQAAVGEFLAPFSQKVK